MQQTASVTKGASKLPKEVDDAIAFLHSMLELVEARRWSHVTDYFALATVGMADEILRRAAAGSSAPLSPAMEPRAKAIEDARWAIDAASALLEDLPHPRDRVPVRILKGAVTMIETSLRSVQEEHLAAAPHPSRSNQEGEVRP